MSICIKNNISEKILVVGAIHNNMDNIKNNLIESYYIVIFNGGLFYPSDDALEWEHRIEIMRKLINTGKVIYNLGKSDLKLINNLHQNNKYPDVLAWLKSNPNVVEINFSNMSKLLVMNGGVTPTMKTKHLVDNMEISFVNKINDKPWQIYYGGSLGYIISNNPTDTHPNFYPYAAQIGTNYPGPTYAQEVSPMGLGKNITI
jgi:hypothetical protein